MSVSSRPVVVVVGSLHYDIMVDAPDRPRKGETVTGFGWRPKFGGKGGNQAVAAARAGAAVRMAGAVGDDDFGRFLLANLAAAGVDALRVTRVDGHGSGMSVAISDSGGDYGAVIVSGANTAVDPKSLDDPTLWQGAALLVLQNEVPEFINLAAAKAAKLAGVPVCLNAAPHRGLTDEFAALVDILMVNAIEAEQYSRCVVEDIASAIASARALSGRFANVVVTAGADGVAGIRRGHDPIAVPAVPVRLISTHGAGDVFAGTFAAAMASGKPFRECLSLANHAAARHVST
ncbi:ribokinase [Mesorhizobium sp. M4A.F.Ca.ET.050.02.1.1]|uniref:PfkB family carbohydrate kinase n=1 Tax=Mesorhizobium sp. M4A.F.Ca.ET.050.02.1.1 TaxID=2496754 RepID=UPI000FCB7F78|nr:PfkB family carbohydrate kinase [Mesorhizobium sp. M4A.F.Ca.ET.050.02.1.1]RUX52052.1 ribokinase [Mesorhizobium sp. M4A.F.Ca.ET.050.02.1.1]